MKNRNNNIELEYKFKVIDKISLVTVLDKLSRKKIPREYHSNTMFDNNQKLMEKTNGRIRLRTYGKSGNKALTYKKPLKSIKGAKQEIEYEIRFNDREKQIENILNSMQFNQTTNYELYRTEWLIDRVKVTLDEYPFNDFVELEGKLNEIKSLANKLGLNIKYSLTKPVDTLFQEWRKKKGLPFKANMNFNDFDK